MLLPASGHRLSRPGGPRESGSSRILERETRSAGSDELWHVASSQRLNADSERRPAGRRRWEVTNVREVRDPQRVAHTLARPVRPLWRDADDRARLDDRERRPAVDP